MFSKLANGEYKVIQQNAQWPQINDEIKATFDANGYVIFRNLFSPAEMEKLIPLCVKDELFWDKCGYDRADQENKRYQMILWNETGDKDVLAVIAANSKTIGISEQVLKSAIACFRRCLDLATTNSVRTLTDLIEGYSINRNSFQTYKDINGSTSHFLVTPSKFPSTSVYVFLCLEEGVSIFGITFYKLLKKGEMYLYHGKLLRKLPKTGGTVIWHQDYGYWYYNGTLYPDFVTCLIALTKSDVENGGLEVLKGSHRCGRIDHARLGDENTQQGADRERVELLKEHLARVQVNLMPGDTIFFHANLLHTSGPNLSEHLRSHLILSYNTKFNSPVTDLPVHALYNKVEKLPAISLSVCEEKKLENRAYLNAIKRDYSPIDFERVKDD